MTSFAMRGVDVEDELHFSPEERKRAHALVDSLIGVLPKDLDIDALMAERWRRISAYEPSDIEEHYAQQEQQPQRVAKIRAHVAELKRAGKFPRALAGTGPQ